MKNRKKHTSAIKISRLDTAQKTDISCIPEKRYTAQMEQLIIPYLKQYIESGFYHDLYYELFSRDNPLGTIVISYGFTESCEKYRELIYYFHKQGYQVAIMDHRGHGKSVREIENKSIVHISHFSQYVKDLHDFIRTKVYPMRKGKPLYLYAHSMGGCIGTLYLEKHPKVFTKAVLSAPMLEIQTGIIPHWTADCICRISILLGRGNKRVFTMQEFQEEEPFSMSAANSAARHAYYRQIQKKHSEYQTSCGSYQWLHRAIQAGKVSLKPKNIKRISSPVLLFQATEDTLVTSRSHKIFINNILDGRIILAKSRHEIWRCTNNILEPYLAEIFAFLQ